MAVHMHWAVVPIIDAGGTMADVETAARRVEESAAKIIVRVPDAPMGVGRYAARMACRMLGEGALAIQQGERWSASEGPIHVQLRPVR